MSTRRSRPMRTGRPYPPRSWGSPRAVSITLQPTSGGARFNRASNILQRGTFFSRHRAAGLLGGLFHLPKLDLDLPPGNRDTFSDSFADRRTVRRSHLLRPAL